MRDHADRSSNDEVTPATAIPLAELVRYSLPAAAIGFSFTLLPFYFKHATDVLLIAPTTMAWLVAVARIWDAVIDPAVGHWSDRTRSRLGRRRPWMLGACLPLALAFFLLWSPPQAATGTALAVWVAIALLTFYTSYAAVDMSHSALGAELSASYHERTRVFGVRRILFGVGAIASAGAIAALDLSSDARATGTLVGAGGAALMLITIGYAVYAVRERGDVHAQRSRSLLASVRDVSRNPHARILLGMALLQQAGVASIVTTLPFFSDYVLETGDKTAIYFASFLIASIAGVPLWLSIAPSRDKRTLYMASMLLTGLSIGTLAFLGQGDFALVVGIAIVTGVLSAGCDALGPSIQADVIDYDEFHTGERKEGAYFAVWALIAKGAAGIATAIVGFTLGALGFEPNVPQSDAARQGIQLLTGLGPAVLFTAGALLFSRFRLSEIEHDRIRRALLERTRIG